MAKNTPVSPDDIETRCMKMHSACQALANLFRNAMEFNAEDDFTYGMAAILSMMGKELALISDDVSRLPKGAGHE